MKTIKIQIEEDFTGKCRQLIEEGEEPETMLEMYRNDLLCLSGNIGECSQIMLKGLRYAKYTPRIDFK